METHRLAIVLGILVVIAGVAYILFDGGLIDLSRFTSGKKPVIAPPPPALSESRIQAITQSDGFNVLLSYTDNGFEPGSVHIPAGSILRVTNNATHDLVPHLSKETHIEKYCIGSAIGSCDSLKPGEFMEIRFNAVGTLTLSGRTRPAASIIYVE